MSYSRFLKLFALLILVGFSASQTWAQTLISGEIDGTVTDPAGAVVPNASVTLTSAATGYSETTTTGAAGTFRFALVKPGSYGLTVKASGFATVKLTVLSSVGQVTEAPVKLEVGQQSQTIEVTAEAPLLHTENANLATTVNQQTIEMVPSPGQDITNYALTTPGVTVSTGAGYGNFTANGLPGTSNLYTVNGTDYNDPENNLNNSGSSNLLLGSNELQEISIVTNGYTGEYGRAAGANVNYTTKSGGNQFHGNAAWWYNGTVLNANDWFANSTSTPIPHAVSNQWVGSIGGPIKKDKLFFFYDNEGLRYVVPGGGPVWIPTTAFANATLANIAAKGPAGSTPFYQKIFSLYAGAPGAAGAVPALGNCGDLAGTPAAGGGVFDNGTAGPGIVTCAQELQSTVNSLNKEWLQAFTVDWVAGGNDTLKFRVKTDRGVQATGTDPINAAFNANSNQPEDDGQMIWTHVINPRATNQFVMGALYYSAIFGPTNIGAALAVFPTTISFGSPSGSGGDGTFTNLGGSDFNYPQGRNVGQYQFVDDLSWTRGNHAIKFGGNFRRNNISSFAAGFETSGLYNVNSMTDFYNGAMTANGGSQYFQAFAKQSAVPTAYYSLGLYIQDEWRVSPKLKVTLALRIDRNSNLVCVNNCYARPAGSFLQMDHGINTPYDQAILIGLHQAVPDLQAVAWGPRAGFAWTPTSKGDFVIRGGAGLFPQLYPGSIGDRFITQLPNVTNFTVQGGASSVPISFDVANNMRAQAIASNNTFQSLFFSGGTLADMRAALPNFSRPSLNTIVANNKNSLYYEWNLQVEKSFGTSNVVSLNFVGNIGANLFIRNPGLNTYCKQTIANTLPPPAPATIPNPACTGGLHFNGDIPNAAPDPRFANVLELQNNGVSNYNGLTGSYSHRFSHGLSANFNYTWSHALDDVANGGLYRYNITGNRANSLYETQIDPYNLKKFNYSNSDYDFRHSLSANYFYQLPFKFGNHIVNEAAGGWSFGGTFFYKSGAPFSVYNSSSKSRNLGNNLNTVVLGDFLGGPQTCSGPNFACPLASEFANANSSQSDFGTRPRNSFRGPGFFGADLSLQKDFHVAEKMTFTLGATAFNVLNKTSFDNPLANVTGGGFGQSFQSVTPPNSPYGNFQGALVSGRVMQVDAKFKF